MTCLMLVGQYPRAVRRGNVTGNSDFRVVFEPHRRTVRRTGSQRYRYHPVAGGYDLVVIEPKLHGQMLLRVNKLQTCYGRTTENRTKNGNISVR